MLRFGCVLLLVTMSCLMISAAPQFGIGFSGGLYDGYGGYGGLGGYGQYGGHYGHGHNHDYHDYHYPHYHHDYHHHHHHDDFHHGHFKRDVSHILNYQRVPPKAVTYNDDFLTPPIQPTFFEESKRYPGNH